ncbi:MAG TPA: hypothetical protein VGH86_11255 [Phenylobacterium sp.]
MMTANRRRKTWAVAASLIAHLAVVIVVALQRPMLILPLEDRGPPSPVIPILLMPKTPPPSAGRPARIAPIRLHRRPQRFIPPEAPTAPIAPPTPAPAPAAPAPRAPPALHPAPQPEGPKGDVRSALRQGEVGCANRDAVGLNRAERDLCDEKFGKGAKEADFEGLGLGSDKQRLLDAAGGRKEANRRYREAQPTPGVSDAAGGSGQPSKPRDLPN